MRSECVVEHGLMRRHALLHASMVDVCWRQHGETAVMVFVVVLPLEEISAEAARAFDLAKPLRKSRTVLERFEIRFAERVVVEHVRPRNASW